jgi:hypothetical protein
VTALVLCGGYARGHGHPGRTPEQQHDAELLLQLIRIGSGSPSPKFQRVFATMFLPDATPGQYAAFDALRGVSATPEVATGCAGCSTASMSPGSARSSGPHPRPARA